MENLEIYSKVREVPAEALKQIQAGRLKGKSDINPMWRIKALTEMFGPCGFGWKYVVTNKWLEAGANGEVSAFVDIDLYVKSGDAWSEAIPGTGGSAFVASERNGLYTSDECYKMALTDAISVACKALGFGANVYWDKDKTKYDSSTKSPSNAGTEAFNQQDKEQVDKYTCHDCRKLIEPRKFNGKLFTVEQIGKGAMKKYGVPLCWDCMNKRKANESAAT